MINYTNGAKLPKVIEDWLKEDKYDGYLPIKEHYSATTIIKSHKKAYLDNVAMADTESVTSMDVQKLSAARRGTAIHDSIELFIKETNPVGVVAEERHVRKLMVDGVEATISAKFDCIEDNIIYDWKNTSVFAHNDQKKMAEWKLQLSIGRWAVLPKLGELRPFGTIVAFFSGWSAPQAAKLAPVNYPTYGTQPYHFELLSYEEVEQFLTDRVRMRRKVSTLEHANSIVCSADELWTTNGSYKYFAKPTNTRATKVSNNLAELQLLVRTKGGVIVEPMPKACEYCKGKELCEQYKGYVNRGLIDATQSF